VIKLRRIRWLGLVARVVHLEFWWENLRKRNLGVGGRIILKCIFKK
jgi:hypothetical protein